MINILGIGSQYLAFAGKSKIYFRLLPETERIAENSLTSSSDLNGGRLSEIDLSSEWDGKDEHIECIAISKNDEMVAVSDSMHGLHLYDRKSSNGNTWRSIFSDQTEKRLIKLDFTDDGQFITLLDKQGDIFAISLSSTVESTLKIKKLLGHTSFISDYIVRVQTAQIVSCDRDEKIRISNFPDAFSIQGFKLGHTESVISVTMPEHLTENGRSNRVYLLSISVTGKLILWDFTKPIDGTETTFIKSWSIVEKLTVNAPEELEVKAMKSCTILDQVYICVTMERKVAVFKLNLSTLVFDLLQMVQMDSEMVIADWFSASNQPALMIFTPQTGSLKCWTHDDSKNTAVSMAYDFPEEIILDLKGSAHAHSLKPNVIPMRKRQTAFEGTVSSEEEPSKKSMS